MKKLNKTMLLVALLLVLPLFSTAYADDVRIFGADFQKRNGIYWAVNVTLKHGDTGWDHYADNWRVIDGEGNVLGDRVLYHPHVDEQPFTRGLVDVKVVEGITTVYIEAHDKMHGWTPNRLKVDLSKAINGRLLVESKQEP